MHAHTCTARIHTHTTHTNTCMHDTHNTHTCTACIHTHTYNTHACTTHTTHTHARNTHTYIHARMTHTHMHNTHIHNTHLFVESHGGLHGQVVGGEVFRWQSPGGVNDGPIDSLQHPHRHQGAGAVEHVVHRFFHVGSEGGDFRLTFL